MNLNLENITFVIVTYKSEKVIYECINSLPKESNKIVIENSKNIKLKEELENKYDNIEVIINENIGMGASNNIGIKRSKTKYAYIINPDVKFNNNTLENLFKAAESISDFAIISPINSDSNYPNYKKSNDSKTIDENIISVDYVDGFSMLINKEKIQEENFFDENFFLYLENEDLCKRLIEINEDIYVIPKSRIDHLGGKAVDPKYRNEIEYLRNWHWMWSKFYFNKKHYGYATAVLKIFKNLISAKIKFFYYLITLNTFKRKIYQMRLLGLISSMIGKNSYYRPKL